MCHCLCWGCVQVERTLFEDTVKTLNNFYAEAEKIGAHSYLEACVACATAYLIFLCMETRYEKASAHGTSSTLHTLQTPLDIPPPPPLLLL